MINSGVIGLGIGEKHAFAYQRHSGSRLKSLCDFDRKKIKEMKTKFPEANIFHNNQSILKDDEIDIVSIASYDNYHSKQIVQAFENGKHVMAEKPLCMNREEMDRIHTAQKQNSLVKLSANHVLRSNKIFCQLYNIWIFGMC